MIGKKTKQNEKIKIKIKNRLIYNFKFSSYNLLLFFLIILLSNKVNSYSEITIKIKGTGDQTIISASKEYTSSTGEKNKFNYLPKEIYINGELQNYRDFKVYNLIDEINIIKLVFNDTITNCISLFNELDNIIEVDLSKFDTSLVTNMYRMFCGCHNLTSINLNNFNTSNVITMRSMFSQCTKLKSLDLKNFDTSKVTEMNYMFYKNNYETLDIHHFNFSQLNSYDHIFEEINTSLIYCIDDETVNEGIKSELTSVLGKDSDCSFTCQSTSNSKKITEKDICTDNCAKELYFKYEYKNNCYKGCPNNTFLSPYNKYDCLDELICINYYNYYHNNCIDSIPDGYYLNNSESKTIDKCNIKCYNCDLESVRNDLCLSCNNDKNYYPIFNTNNGPYVQCYNEIPERYFFDSISKTYQKCFDVCETCYGLGNADDNKCFNCISGYILNETNCYEIVIPKKKKCYGEYTYLIVEKDECVKNCSEDNNYKYEYNNKCYSKCPNNTYISTENQYLCDKQCPSNLPYENANTNECVQECNTIDFFNNDCKIRTGNMDIKDDMFSKIKEALQNGTLDSILENLLSGDKEDLIAKDMDITYQITTTDNQNLKDYEDISVISLGDCEDKLRQANGMEKNDSIIILKIDIHKEGLSIPIVQYEAYNSKTKKPLDLSVCNTTNINIILPVGIDENEKYKYNSSDQYYNDICYTHTTENGTDITLSDRKAEYNNKNLSLCEANCKLKGYESKKVNCECKIKQSSEKPSEVLNKKNLLNSFIDISNSINIKIVKCYKVVLTKNGLIRNSGSYILLITILITIICLIVMLLKDKKILFEMISNIKNKIADRKIKKSLTYKNNIVVYKNIKKMKKKNKSINAPNKRGSKVKRKGKKKMTYNIHPLIQIKNVNIVNNENKTLKKELLNRKSTKKISGRSANLCKSSKEKINQSPSFEFMITEKNESKKKLKKKKKPKKIIKKNKTIIENNLIKDMNDYELNILSYEEALKYDKRTFFIYYIQLLRRKVSIIFTFCVNNDYNLKSIKICLFFFNFSLNYAINTLFFTDDTMHKIYVDHGKFNFLYQLPQILYSFIISTGIGMVVRILSLSEKNIIAIRRQNNSIDLVIAKVKKCINIKLYFLFTFVFILLFLFWYYVSCFCAIYKNTQFYLLKDILISFSISMLYPIGISFLPGSFRFISLNAKNHDKRCFYKISQFLELLY